MILQDKCKVPDGSKSGPVTVTTTGGASNGVDFKLLVPPAISAVEPASGGAGTVVTITGVRFGTKQGGSVVRFNGVEATRYTNWTTTRIKCKVPAGATTGPVTVTTPAGASNGVAFTVLVPPAIETISPTKGWVGAKVTIRGIRFGTSQETSVVKFNGVAATQYISWSATRIKCKVPAGAASGPVKVITDQGASNGVAFKVLTDVFATGQASPDQKVAGGAMVALSGANSIEAANGLAAAFRWRQIVGPPVALAEPQSVETSFSAPHAGPGGESLKFELTIVEADGSISRGECIVNVAEANDPPVAHAGPSLKAVPSEIMTLDASRSEDPEGESLRYAWKQIYGPRVALSDETSPHPVFATPDTGEGGVSLIFELTVTDAGGLRSRDRCVVNVSPDQSPPRADAGASRVLQPGSQGRLDGSGSQGGDNDITSRQWTQTGGTPVKLSDPTDVQPAFRAPKLADEIEILTFELTVIDEAGLIHKDKVAVSVE